jgi:hypothetical protein
LALALRTARFNTPGSAVSVKAVIAKSRRPSRFFFSS